MTIETTTTADPVALKPHGTYIGQHWRGELSLPQSYWFNGVLFSLPFRAYFSIVDAVLTTSRFEDPLIAIWWVMVPYLLLLPFSVWQGVGIWRSAGHRIQDDKPGWAWAARVIVLLNAVALIYGVFTYSKMTYSLMIAYYQNTESPYSISTNKDSVVFSGLFTPRSADALIPYLNRPSTHRLVINISVGGLVAPALRVAKDVKDKGLIVAVAGECDSMCVAILAAGVKRYIVPTAAIRLHAATWVGTSDRVAVQTQDIDDWYRKMGVSNDLIAKMDAHAGPRDFYEPTLLELSTSGLATDILDSDIHLFVPIAGWCELNMDRCSRTGFQNYKDSHAKH